MIKERLNEEIDVALEGSKNKRLIKHQALKRKMKSLRFKIYWTYYAKTTIDS